MTCKSTLLYCRFDTVVPNFNGFRRGTSLIILKKRVNP